MAALMPLKLKYRTYRSFNFGSYKNRTGNSHGGNKPGTSQGSGPRRRAYTTHIAWVLPLKEAA
jgi:hypothetical protein